MKHFKFLERKETRNVIVVAEDINGLTVQEMYIKARRAGEFGVSYHYQISQDGEIGIGRPESVVASSEYDPLRRSVVILIDAPKHDYTDAQKVSLEDILEDLKTTYGDSLNVIKL